MDNSRASLRPRVDINVGLEPVSYCVLSPNGSVVLSCDEDGQVIFGETKAGQGRAGQDRAGNDTEASGIGQTAVASPVVNESMQPLVIA